MNRKMKKLNLNRETVRNLSDHQVRAVAGGTTDPPTTCTWSEYRTDTCTQCSHTCREEGYPNTF